MSRYLVQTTFERVVAYRRYRENSVGYFTREKIGRLHWQILYELGGALPAVAAPASPRRMPRSSSAKDYLARASALESIRTLLAAKLEVSEQSIEIEHLKEFYQHNLVYSQLPSLYPEAVSYTHLTLPTKRIV